MPTVIPLRSGDPRRVGRYRLTGRVEVPAGTGGPRAFLGRSIDGEQVVITLLGRQRAADGAARDRFTAEARAARRVDPFCVTRILDAGLEADEPYLVSEYVPGASVAEICAVEGPLTGAPLVALAIGAATGLAAIHQAALVHGSFGPAHLVLGPEGPRVVHFSITPPYGQATPAADMMAWALTVLHAAVGRPPVGPQDLPALPEVLRAVVPACLAPDPASRPAAREVLSRLLAREDPSAGLLAEGTRRARTAARSVPRSGPPQAAGQAGRGAAGRRAAARPRSRARAAVWALACVACLAAIGAAGWFIGVHPGRGKVGLDSAASGPAGAAAVTVPPPLAGTWAGQVHQTAPVLAVTVQITLVSGSRAGTIDYPALGCSGVLQVLSGRAGTLTLRQHIVTGRRNCDDGVITLTADGAGQLGFSFRRAGRPSPAGVLARVRPSPSPSGQPGGRPQASPS
jgi:hypothetical protein